MGSMIKDAECSRCGVITQAAPLGHNGEILCLKCVAAIGLSFEQILARLTAFAVAEFVCLIGKTASAIKAQRPREIESSAAAAILAGQARPRRSQGRGQGSKASKAKPAEGWVN